MTYQELIKYYPWIDLAWEVFKGISPTVLALVTIFLTEYFIRKRENIYKQREMKLQYLEKILLWIHDTKQCVFEISSSLSKVLIMKNVSDRNPKYNEILGKITNMNKTVFVLGDTYKEISSCMGYEFKLDQFKEAINYYSETMDKIGVKYLDKINTESCTEEINFITIQTRECIKESSSLLVKEINFLYGKQKGYKG